MKNKWWVLFNVAILIFFTIVYILKKNYEFLTYIVVLSALIFIIYKSDKFFKYPKFAMFGFSIWLFLHMAGGIFQLNGTRLYSTILIPILGEPFNILRFDQAIHFYVYIVFAVFIYSIALSVTKNKPDKFVLALIVILSATGLGAINEIIEFFTVALFHATGVGDYYNNSLDLVFNFLGAIAGTFLAQKIHSND